MRRFTSMGLSRTSNPATSAVPSVGGIKQVSIRMVVVFPAPLGPRKPTIWPFSTSNDRWSTATFRAYRLVSPWTLIIKVTQDECRWLNPPYHRGTGPKLSILPFGDVIQPQGLLRIAMDCVRGKCRNADGHIFSA